MAVDATYSPLTYRRAGGNESVIADGGKLIVESGGTLTLEAGSTVSGAGITVAGVTASAAEINKLDGAGAVVASGAQNANLVAVKANYVASDIDDAGTIDGTELAVVLNLLAARINALDVCLEAFGINAAA